MKKYGVYAHVKGSNMSPWLIREFDVLKDANREAYRLARCDFRNALVSTTFIVGSNTGITLNLLEFNESVRYLIEHIVAFNDVFGWLYVCWESETRNSFLIKSASMNKYTVLVKEGGQKL